MKYVIKSNNSSSRNQNNIAIATLRLIDLIYKIRLHYSEFRIAVPEPNS